MPTEWITGPKGEKLLKITCPDGKVKYLDESSLDVMMDILGFELEDVIAEVCGKSKRKPREVKII